MRITQTITISLLIVRPLLRIRYGTFHFPISHLRSTNSQHLRLSLHLGHKGAELTLAERLNKLRVP